MIYLNELGLHSVLCCGNAKKTWWFISGKIIVKMYRKVVFEMGFFFFFNSVQFMWQWRAPLKCSIFLTCSNALSLSFWKESKVFFTPIMFLKQILVLLQKFGLNFSNTWIIFMYNFTIITLLYVIINAKYTCSIRYNRLAREWTEKYAML